MLKNKNFIKSEKIFKVQDNVKNKNEKIILPKVILIIILALIILSPVKAFANTIEYKGEAEGIVTTPDDFFGNFKELMPGDNEQGKVYIKNKTKDEIEIFFKAEPQERTEYDNEIDYLLLEKLRLKVTIKTNSNSEEKLVYEGNLKAEDLSEYISLGTYKQGVDGEFIFRIEVPIELNNDYSLASANIKWVFAVEKKADEKEPPKEDPPKENPPKEEPPKEEKVPEKEPPKQVVQEIIESIKTGDKIYYAVAVLVVAVILVVIVIVKKDKSKKE